MGDCYCDGGGSIRHEPSLKCTVWHKGFEPEYEKQRIEWERRKNEPRAPLPPKELKDDF